MRDPLVACSWGVCPEERSVLWLGVEDIMDTPAPVSMSKEWPAVPSSTSSRSGRLGPMMFIAAMRPAAHFHGAGCRECGTRALQH